MDAKIQELTEKIYNEGVKQGQVEADRLIAEAEARAKKIEADATARAEEIIKSAEHRSSELKKNTESELRLYTAQLIDSLKSSISNQIQGEVAKNSVQALSSDPSFVREFILKLAERFDLTQGIEISTADAEGLQAYFTSHAKSLLDSGVSIRSVAGKPTDFTVAPKDGSFKVQFGEAEFIELFKSFLRPEMNRMLF